VSFFLFTVCVINKNSISLFFQRACKFSCSLVLCFDITLRKSKNTHTQKIMYYENKFYCRKYFKSAKYEMKQKGKGTFQRRLKLFPNHDHPSSTFQDYALFLNIFLKRESNFAKNLKFSFASGKSSFCFLIQLGIKDFSPLLYFAKWKSF
jgi:hypothetical protein